MVTESGVSNRRIVTHLHIVIVRTVSDPDRASE